MLTFDLLPLIEFRLAEGISDEEALKYIREDPESEKKNRRSSSATSRAEAGSEVCPGLALQRIWKDIFLAIEFDEYVLTYTRIVFLPLL